MICGRGHRLLPVAPLLLTVPGPLATPLLGTPNPLSSLQAVLRKVRKERSVPVCN